MMSSEHIESGSGTNLVLRATANSAAVKSPETLTGVAIGVLECFHTSFDTSRVDSQSAPSYFLFLGSCAAMALTRTDNDEGNVLTCK